MLDCGPAPECPSQVTSAGHSSAGPGPLSVSVSGLEQNTPENGSCPSALWGLCSIFPDSSFLLNSDKGFYRSSEQQVLKLTKQSWRGPGRLRVTVSLVLSGDLAPPWLGGRWLLSAAALLKHPQSRRSARQRRGRTERRLLCKVRAGWSLLTRSKCKQFTLTADNRCPALQVEEKALHSTPMRNPLLRLKTSLVCN